ncbi:hypothetical protein QT986_26320, partial [Microcoleus sp. herbarium14]
MNNKARNTSGKFAAKSEVPRKVRSVNLTDDAWQWLAAVAEKAGMSRNDYLEAMAEGSTPLMEMVEAPSFPFMEVVEAPSDPLMEMVEAPSDPFMEMVEAEIETDGADITEQPNSEVFPFIEAVLIESEPLKQELKDTKTSYDALLESSTVVTNKLREEVRELRSQIQAEKARWDELREELDDREETCAELRSELSDLMQESVTASQEFPEPADLLNQLKGRRKKSRAD